jgi:hypothetical protein
MFDQESLLKTEIDSIQDEASKVAWSEAYGHVTEVI